MDTTTLTFSDRKYIRVIGKICHQLNRSGMEKLGYSDFVANYFLI